MTIQGVNPGDGNFDRRQHTPASVGELKNAINNYINSHGKAENAAQLDEHARAIVVALYKARHDDPKGAHISGQFQDIIAGLGQTIPNDVAGIAENPELLAQAGERHASIAHDVMKHFLGEPGAAPQGPEDASNTDVEGPQKGTGADSLVADDATEVTKKAMEDRELRDQLGGSKATRADDLKSAQSREGVNPMQGLLARQKLLADLYGGKEVFQKANDESELLTQEQKDAIRAHIVQAEDPYGALKFFVDGVKGLEEIANQPLQNMEKTVDTLRVRVDRLELALQNAEHQGASPEDRARIPELKKELEEAREALPNAEEALRKSKEARDATLKPFGGPEVFEKFRNSTALWNFLAHVHGQPSTLSQELKDKIDSSGGGRALKEALSEQAREFIKKAAPPGQDPVDLDDAQNLLDSVRGPNGKLDYQKLKKLSPEQQQEIANTLMGGRKADPESAKELIEGLMRSSKGHTVPGSPEAEEAYKKKLDESVADPQVRNMLMDVYRSRQEYRKFSQQKFDQIWGYLHSGLPIEQVLMLVMIALTEREEKKLSMKLEETNVSERIQQINEQKKQELVEQNELHYGELGSRYFHGQDIMDAYADKLAKINVDVKEIGVVEGSKNPLVQDLKNQENILDESKQELQAIDRKIKHELLSGEPNSLEAYKKLENEYFQTKQELERYSNRVDLSPVDEEKRSGLKEKLEKIQSGMQKMESSALEGALSKEQKQKLDSLTKEHAAAQQEAAELYATSQTRPLSSEEKKKFKEAQQRVENSETKIQLLHSETVASKAPRLVEKREKLVAQKEAAELRVDVGSRIKQRADQLENSSNRETALRQKGLALATHETERAQMMDAAKNADYYQKRSHVKVDSETIDPGQFGLSTQSTAILMQQLQYDQQMYMQILQALSSILKNIEEMIGVPIRNMR